MKYVPGLRPLPALTALVVTILLTASLSTASASTFVVPQISNLTLTIPGGILTPQAHLLCAIRAEETGSQVETRAVCYASLKPDPPPTQPPAEYVAAYHNTPGGEIQQGILTLHIFPCLEVVSGTAVSLDLVIPLDKGGGTVSGNYTVWTTDSNPPLDCQQGTKTTGPLTLTPLAQSHDEDQDGCSDWEELGTDETLGGLRDPFNFWDFYDTPNANNERDQYVDLVDDIMDVAMRYHASGDPSGDPLAGPIPPPPAYHPAFDRNGIVGPNVWNLRPADGYIDLTTDILPVSYQYHHDCRPAP